MQNAGKVGFLVLVFVGLMVGAYQVLGKSLFKPQTTPLVIAIADAGGMTAGAKVLLSGVKVGMVSKVELESASTALIHVELDPGVSIPAGTTAVVPTSLIGFGDNPVMLVPPVVNSGSSLASGARISGSRGSAMDGLLPEAKTTIVELNKTLEAARKFMEDDALRNGLVQILQTTNKTVGQLGALTQSVSGMLGENRLAIRSAMANASGAIGDMRKSIQLVTKLVADERWKTEGLAIMQTIGETAKKADTLMASINTLVNDPNWREPLSGTMKNVEKMTDSGTRIAANTEEITKHGITIGQNVADLTAKANQLADEAKKVFEKVQRFFDKTPGGNLPDTTLSMDLLRDTGNKRWRTDVGIKVPFKDTNVHLGIFDAFEANKLNVQLGKQINSKLEYRYGIYASKPGLGVESYLAPRFAIRGDVFDINNPRMDLRARYEFKNGLVGWLGIDRVFKTNSPSVGLGIRK